MENKRINYIDNLRWITVFLLVIYHAAMAYNTWGEANYIFFEEIRPIASIVTLISPWFMPLLFCLAGASSRFSLRKRGYAVFIRERLIRLGIPFAAGVVLLNPVLSYIADLTHNGYEGNYFEHYKIFFTRFTDLSGYDGGFAIAHFWFLIVLLIISLISCAVIRTVEFLPENNKKSARIIAGIVLIVIAVATFNIKPAGKPVIMYLCVYLLGYYFLSDQAFVKKVCRFKWLFIVLFIVSSAANTYLFMCTTGYEAINNICNLVAFVSGLPALISVGCDHLDHSSSFTKINSKISYTFYIIHFPLTVLCQYLLDLAHLGIMSNLFLTVIIVYPLTYGACCLIKRRGKNEI